MELHSRWRSHSVGPQLLFSGLFIIDSVQRHKHADIKCTATHLAAELPADRKWVLISNLASKLTPNYKERPVNVPRLRLARQIYVKGCWTLLCKMMRLVNLRWPCVPVCLEMTKIRLTCWEYMAFSLQNPAGALMNSFIAVCNYILLPLDELLLSETYCIQIWASPEKSIVVLVGIP